MKPSHVVPLMLTLTACAEPSYSQERDASASVGRVPDARIVEPAQDAALPEVVHDASVDARVMEAPAALRPLLGTYAVRVRYFSRDATTRIAIHWHELLWLAKVSYDGTTLQMATQTCNDRGGSPTLGTTINAVSPESEPPRTFTLQADAVAFSASAPPAYIGWDPTLTCAPGTTAPARSEQLWDSTGTCSCKGDDSLPTTSDDCRITDPDRDGKPALTVRFEGPFDGEGQVRIRDSSILINGVVDAVKRHHRAQYQRSDDTFLLKCTADACSNQNYLFCPPSLHPVEFVPLVEDANGAWDCTRIRAQPAGSLFSADEPTFPQGC